MTKHPASRKSTKSQIATLAAAVHAFPGKPEGADFLGSLKAGAGASLESALKSNKALPTFLEAIAEDSPFLRELMRDGPARLAAILSSDPAAKVDAICDSAAAIWRTSSNETELMAALRKQRSEIALVVALADLGSVWDVAATTRALSRFAECAVSSAVAFLLRGEHDAGAIRLSDPENPQRGSGWILLGMGKLGAGELNYSSDIDLIVLFDPEVAPLAHDAERARFFVRLTQRLVKILQDRTEDGYVFRTDLRLRPDPGSTAIAISTAAALQYYESQGQNWERAALIKARPVAGDIAAGEKFLAALVPYIWRKYLDYAAIADIHSIKRQIHDHRGHAEITVAGHNIKLGRGGIREIEFFVQTQQLIAGGRHPELRGRSTIVVLAELASGGWIDEKTRDEMTVAYELLRKVEHRLQMIADEQTHTLPEDKAKLATIAHLSGFATSAAFSKALLPTLETVRRHYAGLFEAAPALSTQTGSLVFTGDADDPDTLETLSRLGYPRPSEITRTIRGWHFGRYPSMRSATARERLTEITPALLEALAGTDNAEAAFLAFDRFLSRLPAGVQLFSLLHSNPGLLNLLATILGAAPSLAETVIARPHVLDALLEPAFFGRLPDRKTLAGRLAVSLAEARDYEDALDRARIFGQEQRFLIGVRVIAGAVNEPRAAGISFTDLAEVLIAELLGRAQREFERRHGRMPGGEIALLALGRLGAREMTAASDIDLILLYDHDPKAAASNGPQPLPSSQYYARLTQRLVASLSAPTAEGALYDVDFRLRPSGKSGPLATSLGAFASYQAKEAWTWEHMALTRARPIAGDQRLCEKAAAEIRGILSEKRDRVPVADDVRAMRATVEDEKGGDAWDLKLAKGGLLDIEFAAQYLQLAFAAAHPKILNIETENALVAAHEADALSAAEADILLPALRLFQSLTQVIRLCLDTPLDPATAPKGLLDLLAKAGELPDFPTLDAHVRETETKVRQSFERVVGRVQTKKERK